jgi:hypothetical protein
MGLAGLTQSSTIFTEDLTCVALSPFSVDEELSFHDLLRAIVLLQGITQTWKGTLAIGVVHASHTPHSVILEDDPSANDTDLTVSWLWLAWVLGSDQYFLVSL